jgi:succinate dehydrogenase flavin-adding protein (antitoxin of CptAB toxin-antitoxin module)
MKQRKDERGHDPIVSPKAQADELLLAIRGTTEEIDIILEKYNTAAEELKTLYETALAPLRQLLKDDDAALKTLMRHDKRYLFDGTDIVRLVNGSLIHNVADKVSIPRDALAICEALGFDEVIKIAKSLDRDAVEKWPDERLVLIGAERKSQEKFSYDLKAAKHEATGT